MHPDDPLRTSRVRRRASAGREVTLERLRPTWTLGLDQLAAGEFVPEVVEIGGGGGEAALELGARAPWQPLLVAEVHVPGVAALLAGLERAGLQHVRVHEGDGRDVLRALAPVSLGGVRIFFPDPWPKARHHKRRLVTAEFARLVAGRLRPGGRLHIATDWPHYAARMRAVLTSTDGLRLLDLGRGDRPVTRYEQRAIDAGRQVVELVAERC